jgi:hypothetical protein
MGLYNKNVPYYQDILSSDAWTSQNQSEAWWHRRLAWVLKNIA